MIIVVLRAPADGAGAVDGGGGGGAGGVVNSLKQKQKETTVYDRNNLITNSFRINNHYTSICDKTP